MTNLITYLLRLEYVLFYIMALPSTQIAAVIPDPGAHGKSSVQIRNDYPVPHRKHGEVLIKLEFSGLCHSDIHSIRGDTPMLTDVAGHEGVGKVVAVGLGVDKNQWINQRVGVRWLYSSCLECEICEINHTACPFQKNAGANVPGTFQQYIVSPAIHVTRIPAELDPAKAAPLLCAGIAMYSSIKKTRTRPGDWLVILGAGGGLGHMGIQIAINMGLRVTAIDKGETKKQLCLSLGATKFLDFSQIDIIDRVKAETSGFGAHAVICLANSERAYEQSMEMLRPLGTLVCVGIPGAPFKLPATPFEMIVKGLTIVGNSAGTAQEMDELMAMAVDGNVQAHVAIFDLHNIQEVVDQLERAEIEGRAVLSIPK